MKVTGVIENLKKGGSDTDPFYVMEIAGHTVFSKNKEVEKLQGQRNVWELTETKNGKFFLNIEIQNLPQPSPFPAKTENKGFQYKADPDKVFSQEAGTVLSSATGIAKSFIEAGVFKNPVHNEIGDFISELYEYIFNKKIKIDKSIKLLQEVSDIFGECEAKNEGH